MPEPYDCERCSETHETVNDEDGYTLANCPVAGTILVATPDEEVA